MDDGECIAADGKQCGPGKKMQKRSCEDGTYDICTDPEVGELTKQIDCNLGECAASTPGKRFLF